MTFIYALLFSGLGLLAFLIIAIIFILAMQSFIEFSYTHPIIAGTIVVVALWLLAALALFIPFRNVHAAEIRGQSVYTQSNELRVEKKVKPLLVSAPLVAAAQAKANDMVKNHYFAHTSPAGKSFSKFIIEQKTRYTVVGENLALGYNDTNPLFAAWIASKKHYANIIDTDYTYTGIGIARDGLNIYVVQLFAK